jgi:hypothetical protein
MKELIERFYTSIRSNTPPPIPYREILLTAQIMDEIFAQIAPEKAAVPVTETEQRVAVAEELPLTSVV